MSMLATPVEAPQEVLVPPRKVLESLYTVDFREKGKFWIALPRGGGSHLEPYLRVIFGSAAPSIHQSERREDDFQGFRSEFANIFGRQCRIFHTSEESIQKFIYKLLSAEAGISSWENTFIPAFSHGCNPESFYIQSLYGLNSQTTTATGIFVVCAILSGADLKLRLFHKILDNPYSRDPDNRHPAFDQRIKSILHLGDRFAILGGGQIDYPKNREETPVFKGTSGFYGQATFRSVSVCLGAQSARFQRGLSEEPLLALGLRRGALARLLCPELFAAKV